MATRIHEIPPQSQRLMFGYKQHQTTFDRCEGKVTKYKHLNDAFEVVLQINTSDKIHKVDFYKCRLIDTFTLFVFVLCLFLPNLVKLSSWIVSTVRVFQFENVIVHKLNSLKNVYSWLRHEVDAKNFCCNSRQISAKPHKVDCDWSVPVDTCTRAWRFLIPLHKLITVLTTRVLMRKAMLDDRKEERNKLRRVPAHIYSPIRSGA